MSINSRSPVSKGTLIRTVKSFLKRWDAYILALLFLIVVLLIWQSIVGPGKPVNPIILPQPTEIFKGIGYLLTSGFFAKHIGTTLWEIAAGFALSVALGFVLGTLVGMTTLARRVLYPYIIMFQAIPKVAFIPLFMIWFGFGASSKIAIATTIAFFPVFVNTMVGMASSPEEGNRLMYSLGASRLQRFWKFQFPSALPSIIVGVNVALTFAVVGVIVAEFQGAHLGLGYMIEVFSFQLRIDRAFATVILLSVISFVLYYGLEKLGHRFVFWVNWKNKSRVRM